MQSDSNDTFLWFRGTRGTGGTRYHWQAPLQGLSGAWHLVREERYRSVAHRFLCQVQESGSVRGKVHVYILAHMRTCCPRFQILPVVPHKAVAEVSKIGNL